MLIYCVVDFQDRPIFPEVLNDLKIKNQILEFVKRELKEISQLDNIVRALIRLEDNFDFSQHVCVYPVQFLEKVEKMSVTCGEWTFSISEELLEKLKEGFRILYVVECTIFVPILASPKWIKGLIREKDFEMQIYAPGFTMEEEKFHLEVIEFDSELHEVLTHIANRRLLFLNTKLPNDH
ncbi:MAG: hypothetical protein EU536_03495 [Promethearchaeota archaeon]|nr:MAG: hypothetical protein EU536_03495 [Candidatus Lokiarchaeota archaeon]